METVNIDYQVENVPIIDILVDNEFNCRGRDLIPLNVVDLAADIETKGLIQPVVVAILNDADQAKYKKKYKLIVGFRRTLAFKVLKRTHIPAIIRKDISEAADQIIINLSENLNRSDLNIIQEARAISSLKALGLRKEDYERRLGRSWAWISVRFKLLELPGEVQAEVAAGYIVQRHIDQLHAIMRNQGQIALFEAVKKLKDTKIKTGKVNTVNLVKKPTKSKSHRDRIELIEMQDFIRDTLGNNLATRTLAWAAGEISTIDLYQSLKIYADEHGLPFSIPQLTY